MKFKKGDKVKLPFNETGTIVKVRDNQIWGHKYDVKFKTNVKQIIITE